MPISATGGEDHQERLNQQPGGSEPVDELIEIEYQFEEALLFEIKTRVRATFLESLLEWQRIVLMHPSNDSISLKELASELNLEVKAVYKFREKARAEMTRLFDEEVPRQFPANSRDDHD